MWIKGQISGHHYMAIRRKDHTEKIGGEKLQRPSINAGLFMKSAKRYSKTRQIHRRSMYSERNYSAQVSKLALSYRPCANHNVLCPAILSSPLFISIPSPGPSQLMKIEVGTICCCEMLLCLSASLLHYQPFYLVITSGKLIRFPRDLCTPPLSNRSINAGGIRESASQSFIPSGHVISVYM